VVTLPVRFEIARAVAGKLGIDASKIEFKETISKNRETFIQNGTVDFVTLVLDYDDRKQLVDFAGPYYVTGSSCSWRRTTTPSRVPKT